MPLTLPQFRGRTPETLRMLIGSEQTVMDTLFIPEAPEKNTSGGPPSITTSDFVFVHIVFGLGFPCRIDLLFNMLCEEKS